MVGKRYLDNTDDNKWDVPGGRRASLSDSTGRKDTQRKNPSQNGSATGNDGSKTDSDQHTRSRSFINRMQSPGGRKPHIFRYRDDANCDEEDARREEIKKSLIEGLTAEKLDEFRKSKEEIKAIPNKKVRQFYEQQNKRLNDWLEVDTLVETMANEIFDSFDPDRDHDGIAERQGALQNIGEDIEALLPEEERISRQKSERNAKWAINVNVVANVLLLAAKVTALFYSGSLSLIASTVDSALDLLCTMIVWTTNKMVQWRLQSLQRTFPVGRRRLEPLGILVFSIIMVISFLQILQESVGKLLPSGDHSLEKLPAVAIGAMAGTIAIKGVIWFGCIRIKTTQVQALAQDCKTDVIFNTLSLIFPALGTKLNVWWLDPLGAGILSVFIIFDWAGTSFDNVTRLSGSAVERNVLQKLTFLCYRFCPVVLGFKSLTAYHCGDGVWVEVDILLDPNQKVIEAHDIAETLQYCLEGLGEVDRAFVTCDYAVEGPKGHNSAGA